MGQTVAAGDGPHPSFPRDGEGNLIPDSPERMVHLSRDAKWKRIFIVGLELSDGDLLVFTLPTEL